ncbi:MAG: zinc ABC transporter substrate-binding protein [Lachnospiraceae bacterium]|nr:zinc ABC transporter substrate-binding protein [Lachnospiraceae bacterium]
MKKFLSLLVSAILMTTILSACGKGPASSSSATGGPQIVTTIFPEYDWVQTILGDNPAKAETTMLLDKGVDLHSFQPTADDILKISTCDLFIYVGGESDGWVDDALKEAVNKDMVVINLMDVLGASVKEEEMVEGMQESEHHHDHEEGEDDHDHEDGHAEPADHEDEHAHENDHEEPADHEDVHALEDEDDHDHEDSQHHENDHEEPADHEDDHALEDEDGHDHDHEHGEVEYDEHVWLSLRNTQTLVEKISSALQTIDPTNAETYKKNTSSYMDKLSALDQEYEKAVSGASFTTLLFGDRFPFRYLVDDYGLSYYAAFVGCSAETEASFETITFLSQKVDELSLHTVMTIENSDQKIAKTIIENTQTKDQQILALDSMQSTTSEDVAKGASYLSIMENNLEVLKKALK